jgi:aminopeptidase N
VEEQPLYRVENQQYIHYRKGSLVFYRLREEIGEATLNRALKKFLEDKGYQQPPYATSRELLDYIRAEAGPQHERLIVDLFEKIGFYDNRVESAVAKKRADGRYDVTLDLRAAKRYADGKGKETAGRMDDWVEVGVFARGPSGKETDEKPLYLKRHRIVADRTRMTVVVDAAPYEAGFDPYNKLIDRVSSDNRKRVTVE